MSAKPTQSNPAISHPFGGAFLLVTIPVLVAGLACRPGKAPDKPKGPNILLVTLDTTRADRLGCYGYSKPTSAVLDALAAEAVVFDLAIAQAAVTNVSHASILTGLNPPQHGCRVLHGTTYNKLAGEHTTLTEVLGARGYTTAAFVSAFPVTGYFGLNQGFATFDEDFYGSDGRGLVDPTGVVNTGLSQRRADATTDAAIRWLNESDRPFFCWVHYFDPHDVQVRPPKDILKEFPRKDRTQQAILDATYDAEVYYMDRHLGRLFKEIKRRGQWEDTIVVVTADHGEGLGDHDWWTHGIVYQEQIRVPLIVRAADRFESRRVADLVRTIDIMPTVLDLAGVDIADWPDMDGQSLLPLLAGEAGQGPRFAYADSVSMLTYATSKLIQDKKDDRLFCVTDGRWKLIIHQLKPEASELYDLAADPRELKNLFAEKPDVRARLMPLFREVGADLTFAPNVESTPPEVLERLRAIGYVDR